MATKKTISAKTSTTTKKSPAAKASTAAKKSSAAKKASTVKKITRPKAAPTKKLTPLKETFTKNRLLSHIAEEVDLTKTQIAAVLDTLSDVIERHIKKRAVGEFTLPGLLKIKTARKAATKAYKGINPFTKEEMTFKAKPACTVVKLLALKRLKTMVE